MLHFISHESPRPVIFVHGAGGNSLLWKRTLNRLSGGSMALAVDLPGHPAGEITCKTVDDYGNAVSEFISARGMERPVVCGHSMGGAVALALALSHQVELGGLILASTGAKLGVDPLILDGLRGQPLKAVEQLITPRSFNSLDLSLGREARASLSVSNLEVFLNDYLACQNFDVRRDLRLIETRTLIVCGDKDRMTPPKWSHYLNANILDSELYFIKDSGHMLPLEKPEALARVVQSFLANVTR
ncbi:MAG TPA: alpha/beta hydrolase [Nitrososphaerales archaeon]|nr:alpha/beta hydrolase [Nitrososphaerales archaeon]